MPEAVHPADAPHEERDVDRRRLLVFGAAFLAFLAAALAVLWLVFEAGLGAGGFAAAQPRQHDPRGLIELRETLQSYEAAQREALDGTGWVDASHSAAKLPIAEAMERLAGKGLTLSATPDEGDCPSLAEASPRAAAVTGCGARP